jgi:hypothetical protein
LEQIYIVYTEEVNSSEVDENDAKLLPPFLLTRFPCEMKVLREVQASFIMVYYTIVYSQRKLAGVEAVESFSASFSESTSTNYSREYSQGKLTLRCKSTS